MRVSIVVAGVCGERFAGVAVDEDVFGVCGVAEDPR